MGTEQLPTCPVHLKLAPCYSDSDIGNFAQKARTCQIYLGSIWQVASVRPETIGRITAGSTRGYNPVNLWLRAEETEAPGNCLRRSAQEGGSTCSSAVTCVCFTFVPHCSVFFCLFVCSCYDVQWRCLGLYRCAKPSVQLRRFGLRCCADFS